MQTINELLRHCVPSCVEPYERYEGIWCIKFSFDGAGADLMSWNDAKKIADAIRPDHPSVAAEVDNSIERAKRYAGLKH